VPRELQFKIKCAEQKGGKIFFEEGCHSSTKKGGKRQKTLLKVLNPFSHFYIKTKQLFSNEIFLCFHITFLKSYSLERKIIFFWNNK
jgi:hypothetical protein